MSSSLSGLRGEGGGRERPHRLTINLPRPIQGESEYANLPPPRTERSCGTGGGRDWAVSVIPAVPVFNVCGILPGLSISSLLPLRSSESSDALPIKADASSSTGWQTAGDVSLTAKSPRVRLSISKAGMPPRSFQNIQNVWQSLEQQNKKEQP